MTTTIAQQVLQAYAARRCFVCQRFGECFHREYEVEVALLSAEYYRRIPRKAAQPVTRVPLRLVSGVAGGGAR